MSKNTLLKECTIPSFNAPLRQGDILLWSDWSKREKWDRIIFVLTADCDIAHDKFGKRLTCIPIIDSNEYLHDVWAKFRLDTKLNKGISELQKLILFGLKSNNPSAALMSDIAVKRWVMNSSVSNIAVGACLEKKGHLTQLEKHHKCVRLLLSENDNVDNFTLLGKIESIINEKDSEDKITKKLRSEAAQALRGLPFDAFFISDIPTFPWNSNDSYGYIAMLRHILSINIEDISLYPYDRKSEFSKAVRVAHLGETLKHALLQKFAILFTRTGIPSDIEENHKSKFEELSDSIIFIKRENM